MAKGRGKKVNRAELADFFGISLVTVDSWVRAGCPFDERGNGTRGSQWKFDTADVSEWRTKRAVEEATGTATQDEEALKRRKTLAAVLTAELELAKARELVAPLDQMERALSKVFANIQVNLRSLPSKLSSRLIGETDERRLKSVMLEEIDKVLEALSKLDILSEEDEHEDASE